MIFKTFNQQKMEVCQMQNRFRALTVLVEKAVFNNIVRGLKL